MKKVLFSFMAVIMTIGVIAQQVPRENVVIEIGTATW